MLLRAAVLWVHLLTVSRGAVIAKRDVDNYKSDAYTIKYSPEDRFKSTIADFFDDNFDNADTGLKAVVTDGPEGHFKVPKMNDKLISFGYFMFSFWAPTALVNAHKVGDNLKCGDFDCGYLDQLGLKVYAKFLTSPPKAMPKGQKPSWTTRLFNSLWVNQQGIMVIDDDHKMILSYLKGASKWRQFRNFLLAVPTQATGKIGAAPVYGIPGGKVHLGMHRAASEVYTQIKAAFEKAHKENPEHTLVVGGHSMGGATSILIATRLVNDKTFDVSDDAKKNMKIFSAGSGRCGNQAFDAGVMKLFPDLMRFTNQDDLYPSYPPLWWGYAHTPVEVWTESTKVEGDDGFEFKVRLCTGYTNQECGAMAARKAVKTNPKDRHFEFFGHTRNKKDTHSSLLGRDAIFSRQDIEGVSDDANATLALGG